MKRLFFVCVFLSTLFSLSASEIIIERPPFSVRNYGTLEIEKIVLNDDATVIYFTGHQRPNLWFRIGSDTYIRANGEKQIVKSADGLKLDTETYTDDSGTLPFSLTFPPIDPATKQIDFIEGDCKTCFKIWGIELQSDVLTSKVHLPEEVRNLKIDLNDNSPLPVLDLQYGNAVLKGQLIGNKPEMGFKMTVYVNNPVTGDQEEYIVKLSDNGEFEHIITLTCTMQVLFWIDGLVNNWVLMSPGKETEVYLDLQQKSCQESKTRKDRCPESQWIHFGGANADLNTQYFDADIQSYMRNFFDYERIQTDIYGFSPEEYKTYILSCLDQAISGLKEKELTRKAREYIEIDTKLESYHLLMMGDHFLEQAFKAGNQKAGIEKEHVEPIFDISYYDFLSEGIINNPLSLYSANYSGEINNCKFIESRISNTRIQLNSIADIADKLIEVASLTPEETEYVRYIEKEDPQNWSEERIQRQKEKFNNFSNIVLNSEKLTDKQKKTAEQIQSLTSEKGNDIKQINTLYYELLIPLVQSKQFTPEEIALKEDPAEEAPSFTPGLPEEFFKKHNEVIKMLYMEQRMMKTLDILAKILGTDQGIGFDLLISQMYAQKFEESVPLTPYELDKMKKLNNPFFFTYLSQKNEALLSEIEKNKDKKGYNVHELPKVEEDMILHNIVKPFEGKVIFIDFWATWCSPCRSAMKQFEPTKKQFADKDVVFVYLTDESSPINAWKNMIPDIPGEHFRLSTPQFDYLKRKFGVKGIPSYLILNKKGEQVYFRVGFEGATAIARILEQQLSIDN